MPQFSARLSDEDVEFLSELNARGAKTMADKMRFLIDEAKNRHQTEFNYLGSLTVAQDLLKPAYSALQEREHRDSVHSEVVARLVQWLPDTVAFIASSTEGLKQEGGSLEKFEEELCDRAFTLMQSILQLGVTTKGPCYNTNIINQRIQPIVDLVGVIESRTNKEKADE